MFGEFLMYTNRFGAGQRKKNLRAMNTNLLNPSPSGLAAVKNLILCGGEQGEGGKVGATACLPAGG